MGETWGIHSYLDNLLVQADTKVGEQGTRQRLAKYNDSFSLYTYGSTHTYSLLLCSLQ